MIVNGIGQPPANIQPVSVSSESSLLIIQNKSDDEDKKDDLMLFAYHVEISKQAQSMPTDGMAPENTGHQGGELGTYNAAGKMAGSSGGTGAGGSAAGSGGSGGTGA